MDLVHQSLKRARSILRGTSFIGAARAGTSFQPLGWGQCTSAPILSSDDAGAAISVSHFGQFSEGQSLVRRTLPGSLAVSTELANRAVSSICLAGLCGWSLDCISFGFDPLSSSSTVGFLGILVSPWPSRFQHRSSELVAAFAPDFGTRIYDNGKLSDGLESTRRFAVCLGNSQCSRIGYQAHCGTNSATGTSRCNVRHRDEGKRIGVVRRLRKAGSTPSRLCPWDITQHQHRLFEFS
jgi:hypothetical protein